MTDGAKALGVSRNALSEMVNERRGILPEMAIRLARAFGSAPEVWARPQMNHDKALALRHADRIKVHRVPLPAAIGSALALRPAPDYLPLIPFPLSATGRWPSRAARLALNSDLPRLSGLDARIADLIVPTLGDMGYELVRVAVLGRDRPTVQVMADRADGQRFTVDDCEAISHAVGAVLDVANPLPNAWTLEVSSAGIDRPLTRVKDWNNHLGHLARAELEVPVEGRRRVTGAILGADEHAARLRLPDGTDFTVPLESLRRAKLVLTDALIEATASAERIN